MRTDSGTVGEADLACAAHARAIVQLLNGYSKDAMGDGKPLSRTARRELIPALRRHPTTVVFLAWQRGKPVGLAICFRGFSTFAARPLLNIHDYFVVPQCRGAGVGRLLLAAVEKRAGELGCCKLTLEVQENNQRARAVYAAAGFARVMYVPEAGGSLFYAKPLPMPRATRNAGSARARISRIILLVRDVERVAAFYKKHFGLRPLDRSEDGWLELAAEGCHLALHPAPASSGGRGRSRAKIVFAVADVPAAKRRFAAQGLKFGKVHEVRDFAFANCRDPEGNPIQISSRGVD